MRVIGLRVLGVASPGGWPCPLPRPCPSAHSPFDELRVSGKKLGRVCDAGWCDKFRVALARRARCSHGNPDRKRMVAEAERRRGADRDGPEARNCRALNHKAAIGSRNSASNVKVICGVPIPVTSCGLLLDHGKNVSQFCSSLSRSAAYGVAPRNCGDVGDICAIVVQLNHDGVIGHYWGHAHGQ